jgi:hypothetical protein
MSIPGPRVPRRRTNSRPPHPDRPLNSQVISSVARRLDACKKNSSDVQENLRCDAHSWGG